MAFFKLTPAALHPYPTHKQELQMATGSRAKKVGFFHCFAPSFQSFELQGGLQSTSFLAKMEEKKENSAFESITRSFFSSECLLCAAKAELLLQHDHLLFLHPTPWKKNLNSQSFSLPDPLKFLLLQACHLPNTTYQCCVHLSKMSFKAWIHHHLPAMQPPPQKNTAEQLVLCLICTLMQRTTARRPGVCSTEGHQGERGWDSKNENGQILF